MNILFICTGNTCRSPMAEAILLNLSSEFEVKSAGIFANEMSDTNEKTIQILKQQNIDINHQVQQVTSDLLKWADVVLTMTTNHKETLLSQYNEYDDKIYTLIEYVTEQREGKSLDINDPFGGSISDYQSVFNTLQTYLKAFINNKI